MVNVDSAETKTESAETTTKTPKRTRIALIGTGGRSEMYIRAIYGQHADVAELIALSDVNQGRVDFYQDLIKELGGTEPVASFAPGELTSFIQSNGIERVIVTTPDYTHADYIVEALEAGADVVVEKPLTIDVDGCRRITEAVAKTGKNVVVTFNYRYSPRNTALKEVIQNGVIGKVTSIDFSWSWIPCTALTTSAAGTAKRRTPAACSSTRHRTTSTWSTGGSTTFRSACLPPVACASTAKRTLPSEAWETVRSAAPLMAWGTIRSAWTCARMSA